MERSVGWGVGLDILRVNLTGDTKFSDFSFLWLVLSLCPTVFYYGL